MKRRVCMLLLVAPFNLLMAQGPVVPTEMKFADIRLKINETARREIQEDVDAMVQSPQYFNVKVQRANLYFPVIERILAEEKVPDDIKYLAIQESALISDAVSSSKAVGYWQFKDFTAIEMGLKVDSHVDERMNIVSSTHGAAKYFKRNNFYFDNWLYALQAYQMGAGAALKVIDERDRGARSMNITKKTYWYVKKYLAHKIAYEHALMSNSYSEYHLVEYTRGGSKTLRNIASELMVDESDLNEYNKWLKRGKIPEDKKYVVIVPVRSGEATPFVVTSSEESIEPSRNEESSSPNYDGLEDPDRFPEISENQRSFSRKPLFVNINGIPGIIGQESQTPTKLAERADITELKFRSYNELLPHESIIENQVYYFKKKKTKAKVHYHTVQYEETLWGISQKYGVRMAKLLKKNRLKNASDLESGMVLWLRYVRPASAPITYKEIKEPVIAEPLKDSVSEKLIVDENNGSSIILDSPEVVSSPPDVEMEDSDIVEVSQEQSNEDPQQIIVSHEVEAKQTLYSISRIYNVEVMDIVEWNDLNVSDGLRIGQLLKIWAPQNWQDIVKVVDEEPSIEGDNEAFLEHRVQVGDTLYAIANKYSVTVDDIKVWNNKTDNSVAIGEKIRIKR